MIRRRSSSGRGVVWSALPALLLAALTGPLAQAQTAQFSAAQVTLSSFGNPYGIAVDGSGNVYVTDVSTASVNEILAVNGSIPASPTVVPLGNGFSFNAPIGIAVDGSGNVYVADQGNDAVYEILKSDGSVQTLAQGTGKALYGLAIDGGGNVFVADNQNNEVDEVVAGSGVLTTLASGFTSPTDVAVDANGNIYVADYNVVDEILANSGSPLTVTSIGSFPQPAGVALDVSGNLYVSEYNPGQIQEVLATNGVISSSSTVVTLGSNVNGPQGVAVDASGNVYVADSQNANAVELITHGVNFGSIQIGSTSTPITFNFTFLTGGLISAPVVMTQGAANLDYADTQSGSCVATTFNAGDTCSVIVTFAPGVSGTRNGAIVLQDSAGIPIATAYISGTGTGPQIAFSPGSETTIVSALGSPGATAVDGNGNLYIADTSNDRVLKETFSAGSYTETTIGSGLLGPSGVAVDAAGNVYIADSSNGRALIETPAGASYTQSVLVSGLTNPQGIAVDPSGDVYVAAGSVLKETLSNGSYTSSLVNTQGLNVNWLAVDGSSNLFLVDSNANQVVAVAAAAGGYSGSLGNGFSNPAGIAADAAGNVYIADQGNLQIAKETLSGGTYTQSSIASSNFSGPSGVAVDGKGNLYVADLSNSVFKEDMADAPAFAFLTPTASGTIDATDGALSTTVFNFGNAPLTGSLAVSTNFTQTSGSGTPADCAASFSLAGGASCNLSVEFTPAAATAAGYVTGSAVFSDNSLNASPNTSQSVNLSGTAGTQAAASKFAITSTQNPVTAGSSFSITVTAEDNSNSTITTYNGTVSLSSTDAQLVGGGSVTLTNGTGTFTVTLGTAGSQTITATSTTGTTISGSVQLTVQPGAAATASVFAGNNQSAFVSNAFGTPLQVQVLDAHGNPVSGASVLFAAPSSGASTTFGTAYNSNPNQTVALSGANGVAVASVATANSTSGAYSVSATVANSAIAPVTFSLSNLASSQYMVTVLSDDAGTAANCTDQSNGSGSNSNCSLRDAITAVNALPSNLSSMITFAPALTSGGAQTIPLSHGVLTLSNNVTITGPGANLLTIDGASATELVSVNSGVTAKLSGLTLANAFFQTGYQGGAVYNDGTLTIDSTTITATTARSQGLGGAVYNDTGASLTVNNSTLSGNTAIAGGAIYDAGTGTVLVTNSTISGNSAIIGGSGGGIYSNASGSVVTVVNSTLYHNLASADGGGIHNSGTLTVTNSTITNNKATNSGGYGGGISNASGTTLNLENSIVAGNAATFENADIYAANGFTADSSNVAGTDPSPTSLIDPSLAPIGNYGGTTQTLVPLPGSLAICGGVAANIPSGVTTDQRGAQRTTTYGSSPACVDAGAVQSNYSLIFVQQPTDVPVGSNIAPAPTVQLNENGIAFPAGTETLALTLTGSGNLTGGSAITSNGLATYSAASIDATGTGDTLTASLTLNGTTNLVISTVSNAFNVIGGASQLAFGTPPASNVTIGGNAGSSITVTEQNAAGTTITTASNSITLTVTNSAGYFEAYTATAASGIATFNLSTVALTTAGQYTYTASSGSLTSATASETVSAAAADTIAVVSGSGQSAAIGSAFTQALTVKVLDASSNPVKNATVTFSVPASGASATLSAITATTDANGIASVTATANGTASATSYNVVATVTGNTANFSLTNTAVSTKLTVTPSATGLVYGQPVTVSALIAPASAGTTTPTGSITFYDGTTALAPVVAVASAGASDAIAVPATGTHTYQAQYGGDASFSASALQAATSPVVVSKASSMLSGPSQQPVSFAFGVGGSTQVTVAGQYSGTGISQPGGTLSYIINGSSAQTATIAAGVASITIPASQAAGSYTITVTYAGDGNYNAAAPITIPFSVTSTATAGSKTTLTATPSSSPYGGSVSLAATVAAASGSTVPSGNVSFAAGASVLGTAPLNVAGIATTATASLPVGSNMITASYAGSGTFAASASSAVAVTVTKASSTLNGPAKQPVTFAAGAGGTTQVTLAGEFSGNGISQPGGSVSYTIGSGSAQSATITGGIASLIIPASQPAGSFVITVTYAGDPNYNAAPSITIPFSVTSASATATATVLAATPTTSPDGANVTLTATVSASTGSAIPAGTVSFRSGTTTLGTGTLNAAGVATYTTTSLAIGTDALTAAYTGNATFAASTSAIVDVTVTLLPTTTAIASSSPTAAVGASVIFTATVAPATPLATGTVTFADGTTTLGTGTLDSTGTATYTTSSLTAGAHSITAAYAGDTTHAASVSSAVTETITAPSGPAADFGFTAKPTSLTIVQGKTGEVVFTLTALNGFNQPVAFTCSGLPADTTCMVPAPVTPTANGISATVILDTNTSTVAALHHPAQSKPTGGPGTLTVLAGAGLAAFALLFGIPARRRLGRLSGLYTVLMAILLSGALATLSIGCGTSQTTPTGTTTVTITGTSGTGSTAITHSVTIQVTITK